MAGPLPRLVLLLQQAAKLQSAAPIDGCGVLVDVPDNAFLVGHKRGAVRKPLFFGQDGVFAGDFPLEISQKREIDALLLGKFPIRRLALSADAQYLCISLLELGDISLIRLELPRSAAGEGQDVERQDHVLLGRRLLSLSAVRLWSGRAKSGARSRTFREAAGANTGATWAETSTAAANVSGLRTDQPARELLIGNCLEDDWSYPNRDPAGPFSWTSSMVRERRLAAKERLVPEALWVILLA